MFKTLVLLSIVTLPFITSCSGDDSSPENNTVIPPVSQTYKSMASGDYHAVVVKPDGTLWSWGSNAFQVVGAEGEVGSQVNFPGHQLSSDTNWNYITATQFYSLGIKNDGTLWAWGTNYYGQLGIGSYTSAYYPTQVGTDTDWKHVEAGEFTTMALKADGTLWGWGNSVYCGNGSTLNRSSPARIGTDSDWKSLAFGMAHGIAIKTNGTLWGWGSNVNGEVGNDQFTMNIRQVGSDSDWKDCYAGHINSGAIKNNGTLWMWGSNEYGQIGIGTTATKPVIPKQVGAATNWKTISIGARSCMALKTDGTIWSWGANDTYILGTADSNLCSTPTQRGTGTDWESVSLGYTCAYALKTNKQLWACGLTGVIRIVGAYQNIICEDELTNPIIYCTSYFIFRKTRNASLNER